MVFLCLAALYESWSVPFSVLLVVPAALIVAYGLLRICASGFGEMRDAVFAAVQQRTVRRVALETFIGSKLTDYSIAVGVKGLVGGWHTDLSVVYGHNQFDYRTENSLNVSYGPTSKNSFDSGGLAFGQLTGNLDVSHEFEVGFAKPLTVAFGAEYRNENFKIRPGETQSFAAGPYFVPSQTTTAGNCTTLAGVYNAGPGSCKPRCRHYRPRRAWGS
eukprot:gene64441-88125_t